MNVRIMLTAGSLLGVGLVASVCISLMNVPNDGAFVMGALGNLALLLSEVWFLKRIWSV